jgi:hypothetical protein
VSERVQITRPRGHLNGANDLTVLRRANVQETLRRLRRIANAKVAVEQQQGWCQLSDHAAQVIRESHGSRAA